jgi:hypothetical protein
MMDRHYVFNTNHKLRPKKKSIYKLPAMISYFSSRLVPSPIFYKTTNPTTPTAIIATHAFDSPFRAAAPVYWLGAPVPVAFPPLPPPTGVGVLVSTLIILDRYAEISAAPLPVAVPLLPLPAVEVVSVVRVTEEAGAVCKAVGVMYVVVVVMPDEMMSVFVVVVVVVGLGDGQAGSETTEEMESAVRVRVIIWACVVATRAISKRVLIAIGKIGGGIKIMVLCFGWFEGEGLEEGRWDEIRWGTYRAVGHGILSGSSY